MISFTDSVIIILYIHCKIIKEILKSSKNLLIRTFTISTKKKFTFEKEIKLMSIKIPSFLIPFNSYSSFCTLSFLH